MSRAYVLSENLVWDIGMLAYVPMEQPLTATDTLTVTGGLTDAELRATAVPTTGSIDTVRLDYTAGNLLLYSGKAVVGTATSAASWQIVNYGYSGSNLISSLYADGDASFDNVWDDRAGLSYS